MKREKCYLYLDDFEPRLAVAGINIIRNYLIQVGKPTEDVDSLLHKLLKAKRNFRAAATVHSVDFPSLVTPTHRPC